MYVCVSVCVHAFRDPAAFNKYVFPASQWYYTNDVIHRKKIIFMRESS